MNPLGDAAGRGWELTLLSTGTLVGAYAAAAVSSTGWCGCDCFWVPIGGTTALWYLLLTRAPGLGWASGWGEGAMGGGEPQHTDWTGS